MNREKKEQKVYSNKLYLKTSLLGKDTAIKIRKAQRTPIRFSKN